MRRKTTESSSNQRIAHGKGERVAKKREPSPSRATRGGESGSDWSNRSALVGQSADWVTRFGTARRLRDGGLEHSYCQLRTHGQRDWRRSVNVADFIFFLQFLSKKKKGKQKVVVLFCFINAIPVEKKFIRITLCWDSTVNVCYFFSVVWNVWKVFVETSQWRTTWWQLSWFARASDPLSILILHNIPTFDYIVWTISTTNVRFSSGNIWIETGCHRGPRTWPSTGFAISLSFSLASRSSTLF